MIIQITPTVTVNTKATSAGVDRFRAGAAEDRTSIKPFYWIDGVPLTEHNRKFSESISFSNINVNRWNSRQGVYFRTQNAKNSFTFSWSYLPGKRQNTVDLNEGRDFIRSIGTDQLGHTLTVRNMNTSGLTAYTTTSYTVLVVDYSETLIRRDSVGDEYFWDCSLTLQEV